MKTPELQAEIDRFDSSLPIEEARTPPSSWYTRPEILELERERVFAGNWLCVGRADQVRRPGDTLAGVAGNDPYVVVRGEDGQLRAFHNVCRHHATQVAEGQGSGACELVCPYHGWAYGLDGRLLRATGVGRLRNFEREEFGLVPMAVSAFGPLVFVRTGVGDRDLLRDLEPLAARLAPTGWSELRFLKRQSYRLACNWKVFVDNYLDGGYHVAQLHQDLAARLDLATYTTELFDRLSLQTARAANDARLGTDALYAFIYPHLMINRYGPWLDTNQVWPVSAEATEVVFDYWVSEEEFQKGADALSGSLAESDQVQQEDIQVSEAVQVGLRSRAYTQGRYAAREIAALQFHRTLTQELNE